MSRIEFLIRIGIGLIVPILSYLAFSFVILDFDFRNWDIGVRAAYVLFTPLFTILLVFVPFTIKKQ